jgi:hypothetical protein
MLMQHDHNDDLETKAFHTAFHQNVYPLDSFYNELYILKTSLSAILRKLESPTLTVARQEKLLRHARRIKQKIRLLNVPSFLEEISLFNQRMEALVNALTEMGTDITEEKLRVRLESLGFEAPHNEELPQALIEPTEPAEAKVLEALQVLSLTNTQGSSSASTSSGAKQEKDETDKSGIGNSFQPS